MELILVLKWSMILQGGTIGLQIHALVVLVVYFLTCLSSCILLTAILLIRLLMEGSHAPQAASVIQDRVIDLLHLIVADTKAAAFAVLRHLPLIGCCSGAVLPLFVIDLV